MSKRLEDAKKYGGEEGVRYFHEAQKYYLEEVFKGNVERFKIWEAYTEYKWERDRKQIHKYLGLPV